MAGANGVKSKQNAEGLTPSQVVILNVLGKSAVPLSAGEISLEGGRVPVNVQTIGPVFDEHLSNYPNSLRGRGLVRPEKYEGDDVRWEITTKGKQYTTVKAQKIGPGKRVPNEVLDPVVLKFKKRRTYGLERYTEDDICDLRTQLPKQYWDVDVTDLWNQILARRKQGAFADPNEKRRKALERVIREFGPNGTMIAEFLTEDQLGTLYVELGSEVTADTADE